MNVRICIYTIGLTFESKQLGKSIDNFSQSEKTNLDIIQGWIDSRIEVFIDVPRSERSTPSKRFQDSIIGLIPRIESITIQ